MKKALGIAMIMLVAMGAGAFAAANATATDNVGVGYSISGNVALLALIDKDQVSLTLNGGAYQATTAGERATLQGGAAAAEGTGGWLHYTLRGYTGQKITVQKAASGNTGYNDNTLSVKIAAFNTDGTSGAKYSAPTADVYTTYSSTYLGISGTAAELITGISGADTWTGTATSQGAQVKYQLNGNPGVTTVAVLYTLIGY